MIYIISEYVIDMEKQQVKYNYIHYTIKYTGNDNLIFSINKVISH